MHQTAVILIFPFVLLFNKRLELQIIWAPFATNFVARNFQNPPTGHTGANINVCIYLPNPLSKMLLWKMRWKVAGKSNHQCQCRRRH